MQVFIPECFTNLKNIYFKQIILETIKRNTRLQNLSSGLSYSLWKNYKDKIADDAKKARDFLTEDSLIELDIKKIDTLLQTAESIKPVAYVAEGLYIIRKKNQSISKDATRIRLDPDFNILDKSEYAKQLNRLYKPISESVNQ